MAPVGDGKSGRFVRRGWEEQQENNRDTMKGSKWSWDCDGVSGLLSVGRGTLEGEGVKPRRHYGRSGLRDT